MLSRQCFGPLLRDWLALTVANWYTREMLSMGIFDRVNDGLFGVIGLVFLRWDIGSFEIGYWLRTSAIGRGYVAEATRLLSDFAFDHLNTNRIMIRCDAENVRSAAVPRRLGFTQECLLRRDSTAPAGRIRDTLIFSLTRSDLRWPSRYAAYATPR